MTRTCTLSHYQHRHEPPVIDQPIDIIFEDAELLVIDKPGSIPVHPSGRFFQNSILQILENEKHLQLYPLYRLDRLTSGLLMFGKTPAVAKEFQKKLETSTKKYFARVLGNFPHESISVEQPIKCLDHVKHVWGVAPDGQYSLTKIKLISTTGKTSLVSCKPITGRTHQIRIHLHWLGYPIVNDPNYNPCFKSMRQPIEIGFYSNNLDNTKDQPKLDPALYNTTIYHLIQESKVTCLPDNVGKDREGYDSEKLLRILQKCEDCNTARRDPTPEELSIFLHAYSYKAEGWSYATKPPIWAQENFVESEALRIDYQLEQQTMPNSLALDPGNDSEEES